jgi:peroxiredoxin
MRKLLVVLLAASLTTFFGCGKEEAKVKTAQEEVKKSEEGVKAYDFELTDVNGKKVKLSDFKGKVVIIQFFGTYCPPCKMEMPVLEKLYKDYGGKVVVLGISVDYMGEDPSKLKPFVKEMGVTYPVLVSDEKTWEEYAARITGLDSIPQTYIIDKDGFVRYYEVGYMPSYEPLFKKAIEELLKE